ncbi:MAG: hypothetical protein ABF780_06940 [Bifidobacterium aquikefiri]|nr:hypothetical protein [Bifidobacterium aquikefiri]
MQVINAAKRGGIMPNVWSRKDEKQYRHVTDSELDKGHDKDRAKEIAAATVNKRREKEGRTEGEKKKKG